MYPFVLVYFLADVTKDPDKGNLKESELLLALLLGYSPFWQGRSQQQGCKGASDSA